MGWRVDEIPDLHGRVALVTGGNGGLGFETVRALARHGAVVMLGARNRERGAEARERILREQPSAAVELLDLDVASLASVRDAAAAVIAAHPGLDILVNNAGVMGIPYWESIDGHELQLATSHLGHFALTALLMPALLRGDRGRVVSITSTGRFLGPPLDPADLTMRRHYNAWRSYGRAKVAALQFTVELDRRLAVAAAPVHALAADPGFSHTDLQASSARAAHGVSQRFFAVTVRWLGSSPARGALPQLRCATDPAARGGSLYALRFLVAGSPVRHPFLCRGMGAADRESLWEVSERLTGIPFDVAGLTRAAGVARPPQS